MNLFELLWVITIFCTLIRTTFAVCINKECPFKCCIDNTRCNPRPDCMKEVDEYCVSSEECYSGCCHGNICREGKTCDDYVLTVGLTLGLFYFFVIIAVIGYFSYKRQKNAQLRRFLLKEDSNPAAKKLAQLFQGHLEKSAGLAKKAGPAGEQELEALKKVNS